MLQHGVVGGVRRGDLGKLLDALHAGDVHIADDLHGIGAPGGYQLAARTDEVSFELALGQRLCPCEEPYQTIKGGGI